MAISYAIGKETVDDAAFLEYQKRMEALKVLRGSIGTVCKKLDAYIKCTPGNYYFGSSLSKIMSYIRGEINFPEFNNESMAKDVTIPSISLFNDEYNVWEMIKYVFHYNYPEATEKYFWEYLALDYNEIVKHYRPMEEVNDWSNQRGY